MNLDFEKSLTYISKDPGWVNKLLAGSGILLATFAVYVIPLFAFLFSDSVVVGAGSFLLCFIFSLVMTLVIAGYFVQTGNRRINFANSFLPDWTEFGRMLVTGLKYFVGFFIYSLPIAILSLLFGFALAYVFAHHNAFHPAAFILLTAFGAFLLLFYILVMIFAPLMMANFFRNLKILSFVDFKGAFSMLKNNVGNYCVLILLFIALSVMTQLLFSVLTVTVIGIIFIPVGYFYAYLVAAELIAQFVIAAKENEQE